MKHIHKQGLGRNAFPRAAPAKCGMKTFALFSRLPTKVGFCQFYWQTAAIQKIVSAGKLPVMGEVHVYSGRLIDCNAVMCKQEERDVGDQ